MSLELYHKPFDEGYRDTKFDTVKVKYPRNIIEWTPEEKRFIKLMEKAKKIIYE